jgi:hypothetical protein
MSRRRSRLAAVLGVLALLAVGACSARLPQATVARLDTAIHEREHLHYAAHLAGGYAYSASPWGQHRAAEEFAKARIHAPSRAQAATTPAAAPDRATALRGLAHASALLARALATETPLPGLLATLGGAAAGLLAVAAGSRLMRAWAPREAGTPIASPWGTLRYSEPDAAGVHAPRLAPVTVAVPLFTAADRRAATGR